MNKAFEKILEKLKDAGGCDADCEYDKGWDSAIEEAISIVHRVAQECNNGWIPCSERLPEEKINPVTEDYYEYPVIYKNNDVVDIRYYKFGNGHWYHGFQIMDDYVTAWQPLPEPYKESEG